MTQEAPFLVRNALVIGDSDLPGFYDPDKEMMMLGEEAVAVPLILTNQAPEVRTATKWDIGKDG